MVNKDNEFLNEMKPSTDDDPIKVVLQLLIKGKRSEASEILVRLIEKDNKIYSLRDDKKEELWIYKEGVYVPEGKSYIREFCRNNLGFIYSPQFASLIIDKVIVDNYISHEDFFDNNLLEEVPVLNGILNLKTRKLTDFTPDKIFFNKINAEYDVDKDCPNIKRFFQDILVEEDIPAMQELFGYCLWKDNFTETSFLYRGGGSNGKSKTIELIKLFLNPANCVSVPLSQLEQSGSFHVSELQNKFVNVAGELSKNALQETQMFKFLTGRDSVTADRKFLRPVTFVNYAKMIFSCNDRPPTYDLSDGFFRRWIVFHFKKKFVDKAVYDSLDDNKGYGIKDADIINNLLSKEEFSGLLNWALIGLSRVIKDKCFSNTKSTEDTRIEWLKDSNNFIVFFEEQLEVSKKRLVSKDDLRQAYTQFCNDRGLDTVSNKAIAWYFNSKGVGTARRTKDFGANSEQVMAWVGCKFKEGSIDLRGWSSVGDSV